jgi:aminopeptidase N
MTSPCQPGVPLIRVESVRWCNGGRTTVNSKPRTSSPRIVPGKHSLQWRVSVIAQAGGRSGAHRRRRRRAYRSDLRVAAPLVVNSRPRALLPHAVRAAAVRSDPQDFASSTPIDQLGLMGDAWALGMAGLRRRRITWIWPRPRPSDADPQIWGDIAGLRPAWTDYYRGDATRRRQFRASRLGRWRRCSQRVGWEAKAGEADPVRSCARS